MKLVITSEQRVGSRWIGYLLGAYLTQQKPMPEIDLKKVPNPVEYVDRYVRENRIIKLHTNTPEEVVATLGSEFKILGIVRDPRDRLVSLSLHKRYHPHHDGYMEKKKATDAEALVQTVLNDKTDNKVNYRMLDYMIPQKSTHALKGKESYYVWTTYEWLKENTLQELSWALKSLGVQSNDRMLRFWVQQYEFKNVTGRLPGNENKHNTFARKGIVGDWKEKFTPEMIEATQDVYDKYYSLVKAEE